MYGKLCVNLVAALFAVIVSGCGGGGRDESALDAARPAPATHLQPTAAVAESLASTNLRLRDVSPIKTYSEVATLRPASITLAPIETKALLEQASTPKPGQPIQIGIARAVLATAYEPETSSRFEWTPSGRGGKIAALRFKSTGAKGIRLGVRTAGLPVAAVLRFHVPNSPTAFEVSAAEIMAVIQRNLDAGDSSDDARTYWSPDLGGDEVTMEIELPVDASPAAVRISVPRISHVFTQLPEKETPVLKIGQSGSCNRDVSCDPTYDADSRSVARMRFVNAGNSYVCTGTLLNNQAANEIPYFLSAYHCISTQTVASTLNTDWFYRSSACNSGTLSPSATSLTGGAALLYRASATDTSFMRLNSAPPPGVYFAGWSAFQPTIGWAALGLHHPSGDLQKFSIGSTVGFSSCSDTPCSSSTPETATHLGVRWTAGTTETGSSGSGLFATSNGNRYLIGQLYGGSSSCLNPSGADYYGRFDIAFRAGLSQWLAPALISRGPVYRFYNTATGSHFYTLSAAERDNVVATYRQFTYEGIAFYTYERDTAGTSPVFRFYNNRTATHFYTISSLERDVVLSTNPGFAYEGISWFASIAAASGSTPLYRFYNNITGTHFYTLNATERDSVRQNYPHYVYEGVAYHVWGAP